MKLNLMHSMGSCGTLSSHPDFSPFFSHRGHCWAFDLPPSCAGCPSLCVRSVWGVTQNRTARHQHQLHIPGWILLLKLAPYPLLIQRQTIVPIHDDLQIIYVTPTSQLDLQVSRDSRQRSWLKGELYTVLILSQKVAMRVVETAVWAKLCIH